MKWSRSVVSDCSRPHGLLPTRLFHPWDFPVKSTGVGCRFLLQGIFPTQGLNPGLPQCGQTIYCLSNQGSLEISLVDSQWSSLHFGLIFIQYASFPRVQSTLFLISTLNSFQGVLKVSNCTGSLLNPYRTRWRMTFSWRFQLQSDFSCQGRLEAFWITVILWSFLVSKN